MDQLARFIRKLLGLEHRSVGTTTYPECTRCDGYRERDISDILWLQQNFGNRYPEAVKAALLAARDKDFIVNRTNLLWFVNNQIWAEGNGGYE